MMEIIPLMKLLGYDNVMEAGVCHGIACMSALANIRGDYETFEKRMKYIENLPKKKNEQSYEEYRESILQKLNNTDIFQFLDGVYIRQRHTPKNEELRKNLEALKLTYNYKHHPFENQTKFFKRKITDQLDKELESKGNNFLIFEGTDDIVNFLKKHKNENATYLIYFPAHTVALSLNKGTWHLQDHDKRLSCSKKGDLEVFSNKMAKQIGGEIKNTIYGNFVALDGNSSKILSNHKNRENEKVLGRTGYQGTNLLYWALYYNRPKYVKKYMIQIEKAINSNQHSSIEQLDGLIETLLAKSPFGVPFLTYSMNKGLSGAALEYLLHLKNILVKLNDEEKKEFLLAKNRDGQSLLNYFISNNLWYEGEEYIGMLLYTISNMPDNVIKAVLLAKGKDGDNLLSTLISRNKLQEASKYIKILLNLSSKISDNVIKEVLSDKDKFGNTYLANLVSINEWDKAVEYMGILADLNHKIPEDVMLEILLAKDKDENPLLHTLVSENDLRKAEIYIKSLMRFKPKISENVIQKILLAKNKHGRTPIDCSNNTQTEEMFKKYLNTEKNDFIYRKNKSLKEHYQKTIKEKPTEENNSNQPKGSWN